MSNRAAQFTEWESAAQKIAIRAEAVAYVLEPCTEDEPTEIGLTSGQELRVSEGYATVLKELGIVVTLD